jgi:hypothetical protein
MKARERLLVLCMFSAICASYGQDAGTTSAQTPGAPPTKVNDLYLALNGNWHITGIFYSPTDTRVKLPFISLSMVVDGDKLYTQGQARAECENGVSGNSAEGAPLVGMIAPDGTFEAHFSPAYRHGPVLIIHGTVPAPGATSWSGTYTFKNSPERQNCIFDRSGAFTATRYPPFTGTYSGAIGGKGFEPGTTVTITTIQGEPGPDARGGFNIPLDGQITVSGSSCFSTGTVSKKRTSTVVGDQANLTFKMNDGSVLLLAAFPFSDPKKGTVWTHIEVEGGQCDHLYWQGVLARR